VTGVAMVKAGLDTGHAIVLSLLAYAGSAQLAALTVDRGSGAGVVGVRHRGRRELALPRLQRRGPRRVRASALASSDVAGYIVGDIMFVRFSALRQNEPDYPHPVAYYLGGAVANWIIWQIASILGIVAAAVIPDAWGLELAGTLALVALLAPLCVRFPTFAGVVVASIVAIIGHSLPLKLGLLLGMISGMVVALLLERRPEASR
jgi:predicted branched-subunit amino acid permease